jgi:putative hemolysin
MHELLKEPAVRKLFAVDRLLEHLEAARRREGDPFENLLDLLGITYQVDAQELARVPRSGPLLTVANHPFGLLEGAILAVLLPKVRSDVRFLANSLLESVPELRDRCIFVDPFGSTEAIPGNAGALRDCCGWLRRGGALVAFPAGEVAHLNGDSQWNPAAIRIAQRFGASVLPVFFEGSNSLAFHLAGALHPTLRTVSLGRELLNKRGRSIRVRIGRPVSHASLCGFSDSSEATEYVRCRTYLLGRTVEPAPWMNFLKRQAVVAGPPPQTMLAREIAALPPAAKLCESGELAVYVGRQRQFPMVVREIGRLRELAFRGAGEGTGRHIDLDRFDSYYLHLVLWNLNTAEVVGAYRLGPTPDILPTHGIGGMYTSTLFHYRKDLFDRMGPALELGRSFVRVEYQKQYAPLLMLWKGIGRYVAGRPECATLFGGVSISKRYNAVSRHLIVKFLEAQRIEELAPLVRPRRPYRDEARSIRQIGGVPRVPSDVEELSALIADLEADGKGVPILIKQYLKTGGRLLGCNVDRTFSDVVDALILVDLRLAPPGLRDRYLGKAGADAFAAWHAGEGAAMASQPAVASLGTSRTWLSGIRKLKGFGAAGSSGGIDSAA